MQLNIFLEWVVEHPFLHKKWLNTLSYWENCGAKKIAKFEHPKFVRKEVLKHAAEEFRHAYFLKQEIEKIGDGNFPSYEPLYLIGGKKTQHYLQRIDLIVSRLLKRYGLQGRDLQEAAYIFVTYAIELRAQMLYPLYERILKAKNSPVRVRGIVLEEEQHLKEMEAQIQAWPFWRDLMSDILLFEEGLFQSWLESSLR